MEEVFIGVDVGTSSARAAVVTSSGKTLGRHVSTLKINAPRDAFYEQSTQDVWEQVCHCVKEAIKSAGIDVENVAGIGFDATCSLAVLDAAGRPVAVSSPASEGNSDGLIYDIVMWMDHRAVQETDAINATHHRVLDFVGGQMSPEMQMGKLSWLKEHNADAWKRAAHFMDLPDFLTYRATGEIARSLCSLVCKWTYVDGHPDFAEGFDPDFLKQVGLGDLLEDQCARISSPSIHPPGRSIGHGLSAQAAVELGLREGTPVAAGSIDAHAGVIGVLGARPKGAAAISAESMQSRLALILGTSSCHMALSSQMHLVPGVWGPYHSVVLPGMWLNEGGQSASGALLDHILSMHSGGALAKQAAEKTGANVYAYLNDQAEVLARERGLSDPLLLCRDLHVLDSFHGNRSPLANPHLTGMIYGLKLNSNLLHDLIVTYVATIVALALGTRQIIEAMNAAGHSISSIAACGGLCKNRLLLRAHASATGCSIALPEEDDAVLLGAAILAAAASGKHGSLTDAMAQMTRSSGSVEPEPELREYFDKKYIVYQEMTKHQLWAAAIMAEEG